VKITESDLWVCRTSVNWDEGPVQRFVAEGAIIPAGHPLLARFPDAFEPLVIELFDSAGVELSAARVLVAGVSAVDGPSGMSGIDGLGYGRMVRGVPVMLTRPAPALNP